MDWDFIEQNINLLPDGGIKYQSILEKTIDKRDLEYILTLAEECIDSDIMNHGEEFIDWNGVKMLYDRREYN